MSWRGLYLLVDPLYLISRIMSKHRGDGKKNDAPMVALPPEVNSSDDESRVTSPTKRTRQDAGDPPLTLGLLTQLLESNLQKQTRELRDAQKVELNRAVTQMEAKHTELLEGLNQKLDAQKNEIHDLCLKHKDVERRLASLEAGGSTAVGSSVGTEDKKPAMVFGGWPTQAKKQHMLEDLDGALKGLKRQGLLDDAAFAPGVRKGICVANVFMRDAEGVGELRERMLKLVTAVTSAAMHTPHMDEGRTRWAAISKPRAERLRAQHAGKLRRLVHETDATLFRQADTGSLWISDCLVGSAVKLAPRMRPESGGTHSRQLD